MSYVEKARAKLKEVEPNTRAQPVDPIEGRIIAVKICSHVLEACIWFSFDPDFKVDPDDPDEPLAVFYGDELEFLRTKTAEQLCEIHRWKLTFGPATRIGQWVIKGTHEWYRFGKKKENSPEGLRASGSASAGSSGARRPRIRSILNNWRIAEGKMYLYRMIAKSEENPIERQLAELAAECATIRLQIDDIPEVHFIVESPDGYVEYAHRINGYCAITWKYICIRRGLTPKAIVQTAIHETRHVYQCQSANRYKSSVKMRERDAELFIHEFFGTHNDSGDAPTLMRTLNQILEEDSDRLWKDAQARAKLLKPTLDKVTNLVPSGTEESDAIRRRFAPVIRARAEAVRQSIDPNRRKLFPDNIEFSSPQSTLKLSYQK